MFRLFKFTSKKAIFLYLLCWVFKEGIYLIQPFFIMYFINAVISSDEKKMWIWLTVAIGCFFISQFADYLEDVSTGYVEEDNFARLFAKIQRVASKVDFSKEELSYRDLDKNVGQNFDIVKQFIALAPLDFILSSLVCFAILVVVAIQSWVIALMMVLLVPLFLFASAKFGDSLSKQSDEVIESESTIKEYTLDSLSLSKEDRFLQPKQLNSFDAKMLDFHRKFWRKTHMSALFFDIFTYGILNGAILAVILVSGVFAWKGWLTIGAVYFFQNYLSQLWTPAEYLMSFRGQYLCAKPAIDGYVELLGKKECDYAQYRIESIELRGFSSTDKDGKALFRPADFSFERGNGYLIVGENGCGKTTLVESILGFTGRHEGKILVNGREQARPSDDFVYVPADPFISAFYSEGLAKGSSGQKKKAQLDFDAQTKKTVYIFDEPTNFLDVQKNVRLPKPLPR